jgi:hypothetical protein
VGIPGTYHTKKQIGRDACGSGYPFQTIDIYSTHWPVTATWDSTLFNQPCINGSLLTSISPGGWFDTGSPSDLGVAGFRYAGSRTFTTNSTNSLSTDAYSYISSGGKSIPVFCAIFADSSLFFSSVGEEKSYGKLLIYPNPSHGIFRIEVPVNFGAVKSIEIYSSLGKLIKTIEYNEKITMDGIPGGLFFVRVSNALRENMYARLIVD